VSSSSLLDQLLPRACGSSLRGRTGLVASSSPVMIASGGSCARPVLNLVVTFTSSASDSST
jgi:hypothetical protein